MSRRGSAADCTGDELARIDEAETCLLLQAGSIMFRRIQRRRAALRKAGGGAFTASLEAALNASPEEDIRLSDPAVVHCLSVAANCHALAKPTIVEVPEASSPSKRQKIEEVRGPRSPEERYEAARTALSLALAALHGAHAAREGTSNLTPFGCAFAWDVRQSCSGARHLLERLSHYGVPAPSLSTLDRILPNVPDNADRLRVPLSLDAGVVAWFDNIQNLTPHTARASLDGLPFNSGTARNITELSPEAGRLQKLKELRPDKWDERGTLTGDCGCEEVLKLRPTEEEAGEMILREWAVESLQRVAQLWDDGKLDALIAEGVGAVAAGVAVAEEGEAQRGAPPGQREADKRTTTVRYRDHKGDYIWVKKINLEEGHTYAKGDLTKGGRQVPRVESGRRETRNLHIFNRGCAKMQDISPTVQSLGRAAGVDVAVAAPEKGDARRRWAFVCCDQQPGLQLLSATHPKNVGNNGLGWCFWLPGFMHVLHVQLQALRAISHSHWGKCVARELKYLTSKAVEAFRKATDIHKTLDSLRVEIEAGLDACSLMYFVHLAREGRKTATEQSHAAGAGTSSAAAPPPLRQFLRAKDHAGSEAATGMLAWRGGLKGRSEDFRALLEFIDLGCLPVLAGCRGGAREGNPDAFLWGLKKSSWIYMAGTSSHHNIAAAVCHILGSLHLLERGGSGDRDVDEERKKLATVIRSELLSLEGTPGNRRMVDEHGEMGIKDLLACLGRSDQKSWPKISYSADTLRAVSGRSKSALGISPSREGDYHNNFEKRLVAARQALMRTMYRRYRHVGEEGAGLSLPLSGNGLKGLDQATTLMPDAYESMVSRGSSAFKDVFDVKYVANLSAPTQRWNKIVSFSVDESLDQ